MDAKTKAEAIKKELEIKGWTLDRWGHAQKTSTLPAREDGGERRTITMRYKFQKQTIRYERKTSHGWARIKTHSINGVYKKLLQGK